jgi:hypothetical protein
MGSFSTQLTRKLSRGFLFDLNQDLRVPVDALVELVLIGLRLATVFFMAATRGPYQATNVLPGKDTAMDSALRRALCLSIRMISKPARL